MSRSTWACELKCFSSCCTRYSVSHAPRERVSWNDRDKKPCDIGYRHAPRERVSWNILWISSGSVIFSHAPRERVSWNCRYTSAVFTNLGHAPRERVSWNSIIMKYLWDLFVTLHVSVWVEIDSRGQTGKVSKVTLHVSVWVEIEKLWNDAEKQKRHAPRERVSWNKNTYITLHWYKMSRSTWACELKFSATSSN